MIHQRKMKFFGQISHRGSVMLIFVRGYRGLSLAALLRKSMRKHKTKAMRGGICSTLMAAMCLNPLLLQKFVSFYRT